MPRRNSGCESCFSTLILVGLSVALVYWDYETLAHLEAGLSFKQQLQQVWTVAMKLTLTYVWFSIPLLIFVAVSRCQRATEFVGRGVLFAAGPNLLAWDLLGSLTETIRSDSMCQKKDMCGGWGATLLCIVTWVFLYLLAGTCTLVLVKFVRSTRAAPRRRKESTRWKTSDKSMKKLLITHNSEEVCTVCLDHFQKGESTQLLTRCKHQFHQKCIESWLSYNQSCPICRAQC